MATPAERQEHVQEECEESGWPYMVRYKLSCNTIVNDDKELPALAMNKEVSVAVGLVLKTRSAAGTKWLLLACFYFVAGASVWGSMASTGTASKSDCLQCCRHLLACKEPEEERSMTRCARETKTISRQSLLFTDKENGEGSEQQSGC